MKRYLLMNIGCIECGVSSNVVGLYDSEDQANSDAEKCYEHLHWREGGENGFEVFDLQAPQSDEYAEALKV